MANTTTRLRQALRPVVNQWQRQQQQQQQRPLLLLQQQQLLLQRQVQHGLSPRRRSLTTSSKCLGKGRNSFMPKTPSMKQAPQKSMNVALQEQRAVAQLPDDVGFLPGTFIMPSGPHLPSLIQNPSGRWKLEKARLIQHTKDALTTALMKFVYIRDPARRTLLSGTNTRFSTWGRFPLLRRAEIPGIAQRLYEEMYTAFAKGKIDPLKPRLCESVFASLSQRVAARKPNTFLRWSLHRYTAKPRLVSHRMTPLVANERDKTKQTVLQQAVVRIASMQTLQRVKKVRRAKDGKIVEVLDEGSSAAAASDEGREVVEYIVVQKMMRKGVAGTWKIWGTTEETTLQKIEAEERERRGL